MDFGIMSLCSTHAHSVTLWSFFVLCSGDATCFKYPTDPKFWTGEFLNIPYGDGLHFYSSFRCVFGGVCEDTLWGSYYCFLCGACNYKKNVFLTKYLLIIAIMPITACLNVFGESL